MWSRIALVARPGRIGCFRHGSGAFSAGWAARSRRPGRSPVALRHDGILTAVSYSTESAAGLAKAAPNTTEHDFRAETQKLLSIVANSLYTEREIFCRELISNASDALEKLRFAQLSSSESAHLPSDLPELGINIQVDANENTFTIQDTGIGMTEAELHENLGTIAHSGSEKFIEKAEKDGKKASGLIGAFGVGFYSAFMVGNEIEVYTRKAQVGSKSYIWKSSGAGRYTITESPDDLPYGTKIVIRLKNDANEFSNPEKIGNVIKRYSSFIKFSISLNDARVNTLPPLWTSDARDIKPEDHEEFYKKISGDYQAPEYYLQYKADAPLMVRSVFYIPKSHDELFRMERSKSAVALYSRNVLIQQESKLLPDYLRFIKGVVDSEDIPLNLSRELLQGSALMQKLSNLLVKRIIKWIIDEAEADPKRYLEWYRKFAPFIREGVVTAPTDVSKQLVKLLRYESTLPMEIDQADSSLQDGPPVVSIDKYIERMNPDQPSIYYFLSTSRDIALDSPYLEPYQQKKVEVLFCYDVSDSFVMNKIAESIGKPVKSLEEGRQEISDYQKTTTETENTIDDKDQVPATEFTDLEAFALDKLSMRRVKKVIVTTSVPSSSPALLVDHESPAMRNMLKMMAKANQQSRPMPEPPVTLELNARHPIIRGINEMRKRGDSTDTLTMILEQVLDNATIMAGLYDDPAKMLKRLNILLERLVK